MTDDRPATGDPKSAFAIGRGIPVAQARQTQSCADASGRVANPSAEGGGASRSGVDSLQPDRSSFASMTSIANVADRVPHATQRARAYA